MESGELERGLKEGKIGDLNGKMLPFFALHVDISI